MDVTVFTEDSPYDPGDSLRIDALEKTHANGVFLRNHRPQVHGVTGAYVRSHPSATLAPSQAVLLDALEILFSDGKRVDGSTLRALSSPLIWDVSLSGAGGLDAGAEAASRWYDPFVIAKEDGTLSTLLHLMSNYALDQQQTTAGSAENLRSASAQTRLAQGVQISATGRVPFVELPLLRVGSPTGNMWVEIQTDTAGNPSGTAVAASAKLPVDALQTSLVSYLCFPFLTIPTLSSGVQYHLVLQGDFTINGSNYLQWRGHTSGVYASGSAKRYDGSSWSAGATIVDFAFKVYLESNVSALTLPSGYTKYARVGVPIYNDGSSNFKRFIGVDGWVKPIYASAPSAWLSTANAAPTLTDLSAFVPPGTVDLDLAQADSSASATSKVAPVPDGYAAAGLGATDEGLFGAALSGDVNAANVLDGLPMRVVTHFQRIYHWDGTGTSSLWGRGWRHCNER